MTKLKRKEKKYKKAEKMGRNNEALKKEMKEYHRRDQKWLMLFLEKFNFVVFINIENIFACSYSTLENFCGDDDGVLLWTNRDVAKHSTKSKDICCNNASWQ